jgi:hypothetical protein
LRDGAAFGSGGGGGVMDRPIIFSAPMVLALLSGRKTQTRRLATSPLRRCEPGDRLWVRENFFQFGGPVTYAADKGEPTFPRKMTPSIHMPRWASRLTLIVEAVRVEPLQAISPEDARDEGVNRHSPKVRQMWLFGATPEEREAIYLRACPWEYQDLWTSLHGADSWAANPKVVAITFRVVRGNIDRGEG